MSGQLLAAVLMIPLWVGGFAAAIWLGVVKPARKASAALAQLNGSLGLAHGVTSDSLWPATRNQFTWTSWPLLKGSRGNYRVEVTVQPAVRWHSTLTTVAISGPQNVAGQVLVSRQPEMLTFSKDALNPFARAPSAGQGADLQSFVGNARVFYDAAALDRLLTAPVRVKLLELPRHWINVGFDGSTMLIAWWGVEDEPAVIEQAFRIGEESLRLLGESANTAHGAAVQRRPEPLPH